MSRHALDHMAPGADRDVETVDELIARLTPHARVLVTAAGWRYRGRHRRGGRHA